MRLASPSRPASSLLAVALTLASCAAAPPDATDTSTDAIVGGTETMERPEIGLFLSGGKLCTATLIRPDVVLTAAHCVSGSTDDVSSIVPAPVFDVTTADHVRHPFAVDRIHTLLTAADLAPGGQGWRTQDIALLHLAAPVPPELAVPAELATSYPAFGASVGVFGYGCTSWITGADGRRPGTGTKRKKEYTWSQTLQGAALETQNVCAGDSGGPLLDLERNAVLGTNSGIVNGNDRFGDVARNHALIEAAIAAWSN